MIIIFYTYSLYVIGEILFDDDVLLVNHRFVEDQFDRPGNTNIAFASMVTANARLALHSQIEKIENSQSGRVLYFDTDSIIFVDNTSKNWYNPELGNYLGEMTDEVVQDYGPGSYITEFSSGGPKNYAYRVLKPDGSEVTKVKVKGIAITSEVEKSLNFDLIKNFSDNYYNKKPMEQYVNQLQFRADKMHNVYTTVFPKLYRVVSEKRKITHNNPHYQTLPFGYK
jgi:hypothetical protein